MNEDKWKYGYSISRDCFNNFGCYEVELVVPVCNDEVDVLRIIANTDYKLSWDVVNQRVRVVENSEHFLKWFEKISNWEYIEFNSDHTVVILRTVMRPESR